LKLETFKNFLFKTVWAELILGVFVWALCTALGNKFSDYGLLIFWIFWLLGFLQVMLFVLLGLWEYHQEGKKEKELEWLTKVTNESKLELGLETVTDDSGDEGGENE
jgi:thiol:disulfide interchange protein